MAHCFSYKIGKTDSASLLFFFLFVMATYVLRERDIHGVLKLEEAINLLHFYRL